MAIRTMSETVVLDSATWNGRRCCCCCSITACPEGRYDDRHSIVVDANVVVVVDVTVVVVFLYDNFQLKTACFRWSLSLSLLSHSKKSSTTKTRKWRHSGHFRSNGWPKTS